MSPTFFGTFQTKKIEKSIFQPETKDDALWSLARLKGSTKGPLLHLQLLERPPEKKVTIDFFRFFFDFWAKISKTTLKKCKTYVSSN